MKTTVEALWALVILVALALSLHALNDLGASHTLQACMSIGLVALIWATWHTHWKR